MEGRRWENNLSINPKMAVPQANLSRGYSAYYVYVRDLIDTSTMQWDRENFFDLFAHRTRMEILAIHLSRTLDYDTLNWTENTNNVFIVKSAYGVVLRMKERSRIEH